MSSTTKVSALIDSAQDRIANTFSLFTAHPGAVGESYFQHQVKALSFAATLAFIALAAFVHALIPGLCEHTTRDKIASMHQKLQARSKSRGN